MDEKRERGRMMCKTIHEIVQESKRQSAVQCYDVLGNERHKAVAELREIPDVMEGRLSQVHAEFVCALANAIGIHEHITFATVRDRLIYLIDGELADCDDENPPTLQNPAETTSCEPDAIAEYHRILRQMMGEAKCVRDRLVTQAESHAKLKHECRMYRAMLNDAAKEFSLQRTNYEQAMAGYRECAAALEDSERLRRELEQERYAYKQNYHDIIHGNEINAEWFDKRGFIELPKGADGKHIRIGDTVRWGDVGEPFEVQVIYYYPDGEVRVSDDGIDVSACQCVHVDEVFDPIASAIDKYDAGLMTRDELVAALREAS